MTAWTLKSRLHTIYSAMRSIRERASEADYVTDLGVLEDKISDIEVDIEYCRKHLEAAYQEQKERQSNDQT